MKDILQVVGKSGKLTVDIWQVNVIVTDARVSFGRIDYQVEAANGAQAWVNSDRVQIKENGE